MGIREDLSIAIVDALAAWGAVEVELAMLFVILAGFSRPSKTSVFSRTGHLIFDTIISFDTRMDIVDALTKDGQFSELEQETWNRCSIRLRKLYKRRHELAHFIFNAKINDDGSLAYHISPFFTFSAAMRSDLSTLDVPRIIERKEHFAEMVKALSYFARFALDKNGHAEGIRLPEPPIVSRFRISASQILEERQTRQRSSRPKSKTDD